MRSPTTDEPTGIHRVALTPAGRKIDRRMLGCAGVVKLWPAESTLIVGEGIEKKQSDFAAEVASMVSKDGGAGAARTQNAA